MTRTLSPARHRAPPQLVDRGWGWRVRFALRILLLVVFLAPVAFMVTGSLRRAGLPPPGGSS